MEKPNHLPASIQSLSPLDISEKEKDPSPNLSPKRREALKPPSSLVGKGGRGVRFAYNYVVSKSFLEMSSEEREIEERFSRYQEKSGVEISQKSIDRILAISIFFAIFPCYRNTDGKLCTTSWGGINFNTSCMFVYDNLISDRHS